jgi:hypothetical protein
VDERASQQIEPGKTWDLLMINELAKKQMKVDDSEIQRKASMKKSKTSLRKFLPNFATRRNKAPKSDAPVKGKAKKQQK